MERLKKIWKKYKKMVAAVLIIVFMVTGIAVVAGSRRLESVFDPDKYDSNSDNGNEVAYDSAIFGNDNNRDGGLELDKNAKDDYEVQENGDEHIKESEAETKEIMLADNRQQGNTEDQQGESQQTDNNTPSGESSQAAASLNNDGSGPTIAPDDAQTSTTPGNNTDNGTGTTPNGTTDPSTGTNNGTTTPQNPTDESNKETQAPTPQESQKETDPPTPQESQKETDPPAPPQDTQESERPDDTEDTSKETEPEEPEDPDDDKYGTDYGEDEDVVSDYPTEDEDQDEDISSNKLSVVGSLKQHFYPGETPRPSELKKYIQVSATMSDGTKRLDLWYKQSESAGGDYTIEWDSKAGGSGSQVGSQPGSYTAKIHYRGEVVTLNYDIVQWQVTLLDFDEKNVALTDRFSKVLTPSGNPKISLTDAKNEMYTLIAQRTEEDGAKGTKYTYKNQIIYEEQGFDYCTQYFGGWNDKKDAAASTGSYYLMERPQDQQIVNGVYNVNLYPQWVDSEQSTEYRIVLSGSIETGIWQTYLLAYYGKSSTMTIPEGVDCLNLTTLYYNATGAKGYPNVTKIVLPESLYSISYMDKMNYVEAFPNLKEFEVAVQNQSYLDIDGIIYNKTGKELLMVPAAKTQINKWSKTVAEIGSDAFQSVHMNKVAVPESVRVFDEGCFYNADIKTLEFLTKDQMQWGKYAFSNCFDNSKKVTGIENLIIHSTQTPTCEVVGDYNLSFIFGEFSQEDIRDSGFHMCVPDSENDEVYMEFLREMQGPMDMAASDMGMTYSVLTTPQKADEHYTYEDGFLYSKDLKNLIMASTMITGEIVLKDSLETIAASAFLDCAQIESIETGSHMKSIGDRAFENTTLLKKLLLESEEPPEIGHLIFGSHVVETVKIYVEDVERYISAYQNVLDTDYGEGAAKRLIVLSDKGLFVYDGCVYKQNKNDEDTYTLIQCDVSKFGGITLKEGTTAIADGAFLGCTNLEAVVFPETVTTFGNYLFEECPSLDTIVVNSTVVPSMETDTFKDVADRLYCFVNSDLTGDYEASLWKRTLNNLKAVNTNYMLKMSSNDSWAVYDDGTGLVYALPSNEGVFYAASGTTKIYNEAFMGRTEITSVMGTNEVLEIGERAFEGCGSIKNIYLGVQDGMTFGKAAFKDCTSLTSLKSVPAEQTYLPAGLISLPEQAFSGCTSLKTVVIAGALEEIGNECFNDCESLENVTWNTYENMAVLKTIGDRAFYQSGITNLYWYQAYGLTSLGEEAFANCSHFTGLQLPQNLESIGEGCFMNCPQLAGIKYTDLPEVTLLIPRNVTKLLPNTFYGCDALESVYLSGLVTEIGDSCFEDCDSIYRFYWGSTTSRDALWRIGNRAFYKSGMTDFNWYLASGLKILGDEAFYGCENMQVVRLPQNLESMGERCFADCTSLLGFFYSDLKEYTVLFPSSLTDIPDEAFSGCTSIGRLYMMNQKTIGDQSFYGCTSLRLITWTVNATKVLESIGDHAFYECLAMTDNGLIYNSSQDYFVNLTDIGNYAFYGCSSLKSGNAQNIPMSVNHIGDYAFAKCGMKYVYFRSNVSEMGEYSFADCPELIQIQIMGPFDGSGTVIGDYAFSGCENMGNLVVAGALKRIGSYSFAGCSNMVRVQWQSNTATNVLESIGDYAFSGCNLLTGLATGTKNMTSAQIQANKQAVIFDGTDHYGQPLFDHLTSLGMGVFKGCSGLIEMSIPETIQRLPDEAFMDCSSLEYISYSDTVKSIGNACFMNCEQLLEAVISASLETLGNDAYIGCTNLETVEINQMFDYSDGVIFNRQDNMYDLILGADFNSETLDASALSIFSSALELDINGHIGCLSGSFASFSNLDTVNIGDDASVEVLDTELFAGCAQLMDVYIWNGVKEIRSRCFADDPVLEQVYVISDDLINISKDSFMGCTNENLYICVNWEDVTKEYPVSEVVEELQKETESELLIKETMETPEKETESKSETESVSDLEAETKVRETIEESETESETFRKVMTETESESSELETTF